MNNSTKLIIIIVLGGALSIGLLKPFEIRYALIIFLFMVLALIWIRFNYQKIDSRNPTNQNKEEI